MTYDLYDEYMDAEGKVLAKVLVIGDTSEETAYSIAYSINHKHDMDMNCAFMGFTYADVKIIEHKDK